MSTPKRLQRKRTRGWRKPPNSVCVSRPSRWGNPWTIQDYGAEAAARDLIANRRAAPADRLTVEESNAAWLPYAAAIVVERFRQYAEERAAREPQWLEPLRGKDLLCYCKESEPCHADVLIALANDTERADT